MKKNKGFMGVGLIIAIIVGVLIVGGVAYYLGTKNNSVQKVVENNIPEDNVVDTNTETNQQIKDEQIPVPEKETTQIKSIKVLSPNGGEKIVRGELYTIKWSTVGFTKSDKVRISLKNDSINCAPGLVGCWTEFGIVGTQLIQNTGSYVWDTNQKMFGDGGPNSVPVSVGNKYRIHVEVVSTNNSINVSDLSDNVFSIISNCPQYVSPAPGWCSNGIITPPGYDDNGCLGHPTCTPSVLQTIYSNYSNGQISECTYQGASYYSAGINAYDGGQTTYDMSGNRVGWSGGITGQATGIQPTNCTRIYAVYPNIWGYPAINTYNLH